ncbi:MAG: ATP-binding cassette domain-containing protein [Silicimonas sp.]|nr:ATP-binding cassette domain-containing protein [Silicimonas sp.]
MTSDAKPMLECAGLWKVFGPAGPNIVTELGVDAPAEAFKARGLVVGARDVNIRIFPGEIFVIMGLSGSGKSTLVRCMTRLHEPTAGALYLGGQDITHLSDRELVGLRRTKMSMVFQDFALLPHLTVLDNVAFPLSVQGRSRAEARARAHEMIDLVGLKGRETYFPDELSGGQQQRVGIARSLTTEPDVWFLDEPFSALDPLIRHDMQAEFLRLQKMLHKTIVFITHDFEEAVRLADRIAIMKDGEVIQQGRPEELVLSPATDYVREFTRNIPKQKVLKVAAIMTEPDEGASGAPVEAGAGVDQVAARILESDGPVPVARAGEIVGSLHRRDLVPILT